MDKARAIPSSKTLQVDQNLLPLPALVAGSDYPSGAVRFAVDGRTLQVEFGDVWCTECTVLLVVKFQKRKMKRKLSIISSLKA